VLGKRPDNPAYREPLAVVEALEKG